MTTDPWPARAATDLTLAHHLHTVSAGFTNATCSECEITFDERYSPRIQARAQLHLEQGQLEPRRDATVGFNVGYWWDDSTGDQRQAVRTLAGLYVRHISPNVGGVMEVQCVSGEALLQDYAPIEAVTHTRENNIVTLLGRLMVNTGTDWPLSVVGVPDTVWKPPSTYGLEPLTIKPGEYYWPVIQDIATRVGAEIWADGQGEFRLTARPWSTDVLAATFTPELMTNIEWTFSRDDYANTVIVKHTWSDTAGQHEVTGHARILSGSFAPYNTPKWPDEGFVKTSQKTMVIENKTPTTPAAAQAAAEAIVQRAVSAGWSLRFSAPAMYWLRPGDAIEVPDPDATGTERHLISAVSFYPHRGEMTITTRRPEDAQIGA